MNWHFLNQTAHLYFIIWSKIFLILCSKLNENEALSGEVGSGSEDTVQSSVTWPAGCPSQVIGNFRLASRGDQKAEVFLLFLYPFMSNKVEGSSGRIPPSSSGFSLPTLYCIDDGYCGPLPCISWQRTLCWFSWWESCKSFPSLAFWTSHHQTLWEMTGI